MRASWMQWIAGKVYLNKNKTRVFLWWWKIKEKKEKRISFFFLFRWTHSNDRVNACKELERIEKGNREEKSKPKKFPTNKPKIAPNLHRLQSYPHWQHSNTTLSRFFIKATKSFAFSFLWDENRKNHTENPFGCNMIEGENVRVWVICDFFFSTFPVWGFSGLGSLFVFIIYDMV